MIKLKNILSETAWDRKFGEPLPVLTLEQDEPDHFGGGENIDILGFKHKTSLEDGLAKMWEWAKKQPMRERFVWPDYELEKGIYSFWKN